MQAIRQIYENAPPTIAIPESIQHRRLEVILLVQDETQVVAPQGLKALLAGMPDVGEDSDFARPADWGRKEEPWDS
ncbi:MAG: hypothetical protein HZB55_11250 [Deltaproteobacteria bacterium]|nr:hypothetical protein [Deltaproteobacteria bacterium]